MKHTKTICSDINHGNLGSYFIKTENDDDKNFIESIYYIYKKIPHSFPPQIGYRDGELVVYDSTINEYIFRFNNEEQFEFLEIILDEYDRLQKHLERLSENSLYFEDGWRYSRYNSIDELHKSITSSIEVEYGEKQKSPYEYIFNKIDDYNKLEYEYNKLNEKYNITLEALKDIVDSKNAPNMSQAWNDHFDGLRGIAYRALGKIM